MEYINPNALECYEDVIKEINREHELSAVLDQQMKKADDEIIALKIALSQNELRKHISHTTLKIFDNIFDVYNLYKDDLQLNNLLQMAKISDQKYYLIEIYLSELLVEKVLESWNLIINIYNKDFSVNKVSKLIKKLPIIEVIPIDEKVIDCKLDTMLYLMSEGNCMTINLNHIDIDVSYHFVIFRDDLPMTGDCDKYVNITKLYNKNTNLNLDLLLKPIFFEYKISLSLSKDGFIELFLRNSYHRLDIELFSELSSESEKSVNISFAFNSGSRCIINYDPKSKNFKLKCTTEDLYILKKYIFKQVPLASDSEQASSNLQSLSAKIVREDESIEKLKTIVEQRRKFIK